MNSVFLLVAALVVFAFGYRFYAKLLALDIFRLEKNYSTPAHTHYDGRVYVPAERHLLLGHHVAAVAGGAVFVGPVMAASWGWIPAFLWIVAGTTVVGGCYSFGSYWLSVHQIGTGLPEVAGRLAGPFGRYAVPAIAIVGLLIMVSTLAGLAAELLASYPTTVLPFVALALVALLLGRVLHGRPAKAVALASVIALLLSVALIAMLDIPLAVRGQLQLALGQAFVLTVDGRVLWLIALLGYGLLSMRAPVWLLARPRGYLTAMLAVLASALFIASLVWQHPLVAAPEFHRPEPDAGALPWLFVVLTTGALAGSELLLIYGVTARQLKRETDAGFVGYGGALAVGLIALVALLVALTAFPDTDTWRSAFRDPPSPGRAIQIFIDGYARAATTVGLGLELARTFVATVAVSAIAATFEAGLHTVVHLIAELRPSAESRSAPMTERNRALLLGGIGMLALALGASAWALFGLFSLWLAALGFLLIALALRASDQPDRWPLILAGGVALVALWATLLQVTVWWQTEQVAPALLGACLAAASLGVLGQAGWRAWRAARRGTGVLDT